MASGRGGETVLAPAVAGRLVTRLRRTQEPALPQLSPRETEILVRAARGMTNVDIGRDLFISEATVKTHLLRACTKLGVSGRTAAVAAATERGLLRPPAR
jgi:DNA-binding NarL/FixJ family response regulator